MASAALNTCLFSADKNLAHMRGPHPTQCLISFPKNLRTDWARLTVSFRDHQLVAGDQFG